MSTADDDVRKVLGVGRSKGLARLIKWGVIGVIAIIAVLVTMNVMKKRAAAMAPQYLTEPVKRSDIRVTVSATGKIQGLNTVEIGAEVTGKVLRVLVDYNDHVKKGQVLAEIDPEQLRAAVDETTAQVSSAEASIKTAQATLTEAKQSRDRAEEQAKQGLISQKDLEAARAAAARAEASVSSASASANLSRASLKSAQSRAAKTKIVSPIDGIVLARAVEPGQTVTAGFQTPIMFRVAEDLTKLSLHVDIDEADIGRVKEGSEATFNVDAYQARTFPSKVTSLRNEPKTSQSVVSYEAVLTVDNSESLLRPGMTATATIISETVKDAIVLPSAALRFTPPVQPGTAPPAPPKADEKRVYVLRQVPPAPSPTLVPTPVKVGVSDGHVTQLIGPAELTVGTEVVVDAVIHR